MTLCSEGAATTFVHMHRKHVTMMTKEEKKLIKELLRCPTCSEKLTIHRTHLACREMSCEPRLEPKDIGLEVPLQILWAEVPDWRSESSWDQAIWRRTRRLTKGPPGFSAQRQPESLPGQRYLFS